MIHRIEQGFFVLLQIFVVRKWQTFDCREHRDEVANLSARLAANEFERVGVLLLWHQA